jgi:HlyD family secretion protein
MTLIATTQRSPSYFLLFLSVCALLLGACESQSLDPDIRTAVIDTGGLVVRVTAVGTVQPLALTKVSTQLSGQVAEVLADFNDLVQKGQVLARLDEQSFRARLQEAQAELDVASSQLLVQRASVERAKAQLLNRQAKRAVLQAEAESAAARERKAAGELSRVRPLAKQATVSKSELEEAESEFDSAQALREAADAWLQVQDAEIRAARADLDMAEAQLGNVQAQIRQREAAEQEARVNLERTAIRSPLDGVVIRRDVEPGQTVAASLQAPTLFSLAGDLRSMRVETRVDEADIGRVRVGQAVEFRVDAYPHRVFTGKVHKIHMAPELVQNVVTYNVLVDAPNPDLALLPGMTALVRITVEEHTDALLLPNAALRFMPPSDWPSVAEPASGKTWIWRAGEGGPAPVEVKLGPSDDLATVVKGGGLRAGDQVIIGLGDA